ncbi:hypothetical protein NIES3806_42110 [Microcystis aeruginosa NIES-3806]|uniref:hypothetical protein n=1 Tax=Microcystis aeruginosa TaxID=1126 RepID=UPI00130AB6F5|nr:hypothetical protein [Microcystis aeruginosa]GCL56842.1 hypothetical protein NIES3806_42110 [Microcystis aeruginosa NIES-3806]
MAASTVDLFCPMLTNSSRKASIALTVAFQLVAGGGDGEGDGDTEGDREGDGEKEGDGGTILTSLFVHFPKPKPPKTKSGQAQIKAQIGILTDAVRSSGISETVFKIILVVFSNLFKRLLNSF